MASTHARRLSGAAIAERLPVNLREAGAEDLYAPGAAVEKSCRGELAAVKTGSDEHNSGDDDDVGR